MCYYLFGRITNNELHVFRDSRCRTGLGGGQGEKFPQEPWSKTKLGPQKHKCRGTKGPAYTLVPCQMQ